MVSAEWKILRFYVSRSSENAFAKLYFYYMYMNFYLYSPSFCYKQKSGEDEIQLPCCIGGIDFLDHTYVFVDEVVTKIFVYLLKTNPSLYENIVNLFEHHTET